METAESLEIRLARDDELVAASRLTLPGLPASRRRARRMIDAAPEELGLDLRHQAVAVRLRREIVGACLYVLTAGRGATVMPPVVASDVAQADRVERRLIEAAWRASRAAGAALIQALLNDGPTEPVGRRFLDAGFDFLALLEYLELSVGKGRVRADDAEGPWSDVAFTAASAEAFKELILATYEGSLDCPPLDGLRAGDDVIAAHQASGIFTPAGWRLLSCEGEPVGVVLVNRVLGRSACELVYMGVVPRWRGRGVGRRLVARAVATARQLGCRTLTVAVDARNWPAVRLYRDAGFRRVGQRHTYFVPPERT